MTDIDIAIVVWGCALYFVPMFIALCRSHPQIVAISLLNLLLGWTILGWVGALIWASIAYHHPPLASQQPRAINTDLC